MVSKPEALGACKECQKAQSKDKFIPGCIITDIEASKDEDISAPPCMLSFLSSTSDQRPPEIQKGSQAKPLSSVQKSSLFDTELSKNPQKKSISGKRKGSHTITKSEPKGSQEGSFSGGARTKESSRLTKTQKEILRDRTEEFLTTKQTAIKHGCSTSFIYRNERILRKKGFLNSANQAVHEIGGTCELSVESDPGQQHAKGGAVHEKQKRLHGQEINGRILYKDERYKKKVGQVIFIDGNTVRCYRDSIEVYSGQSFYADDVQKATAKSMEYWTRFFVRLENDLKIILVKPRAQNIKLVRQHYSEVGNELATECEMTGDKIRVYAKEDGKLWFTIDNSFNLREAETLHPQTAKEDMEKVVRHFNDMRDNNPPTLSELMAIQQETAKGLNIIVTHQVNQLPKDAKAPKEKSKPDMEDLGGYA